MTGPDMERLGLGLAIVPFSMDQFPLSAGEESRPDMWEMKTDGLESPLSHVGK